MVRPTSEHASSAWNAYLRPLADGEAPVDPAAFAEHMRHPDYPRSSAYDPTWVRQSLMGPNVLWLTESLAAWMSLEAGMRVLDLGCGAAISSIFLAAEYGVQVWAADMWIDPSRNRARVVEAGVADRVFPLEAEAHSLPFPHGFFDAAVCVDAYHYFGTDMRYLSYLAQFVREGGRMGIVVPGNDVDPDDMDDAFAARAPLGADYFTFRSADWWGRHWSRTDGVVVEDAAMIPDGWELWQRHHRADSAWTGEPAEQCGDAPLLLSEHGRTLGFARVVARRTAGPTLVFGPGRYATRLA